MSTLRFRFWDDKNKTWLKENNYAINGDGLVYCIYDNVAEIMPKHIIPIQSTGLLDKNGVEIFEGYILSGRHVIGWSRGRLVAHYTCQCSSKGWDYSDEHEDELYQESEYAEVIGNIYEHSHLLK